MLDTETKKRIDTARDILVGKLPDPKSQVEQITIALIYKFMDDMDKQSEELGGKAKFFSGEYAKYSWSKIFDPRISGHELVILYGEAIQGMNQNQNIPELFRSIFKNAYLPYRDPETLKSFLKIIAEFEYDHSEKLGDAFEYLLSVMGSQGDAGQFRTPRHIIDFIVKIVDPAKNETILDPACGTAGFLISAYKHILERNKKDGRSHLTPDERKRLIENLSGYDISPDMVRLSLVNMYLHDFQNPKIYEYDALTSEDRWNERFDVVLANPPFMTPKGGIRPHKRFSVQANRSEVLFVDYIAEHLNPSGRAGVIVPEGIIFQSANAYKALRKMLVENGYLYAVVSLPSGVFNPYAGVKTSILLMDKNLAKKTRNILFVKVENDGFDLGAQRRPVAGNDIPRILDIVLRYRQAVLKGEEPTVSEEDKDYAQIVAKDKIVENGDYNLSGDRYKEVVNFANQKWEMVELGSVCDIHNGSTPLRDEKSYWENGTIPWFTIDDIRNQGRRIRHTAQKITQSALKKTSVKLLPKKTVLLCCTASVGEYAIAEIETTTNQQFNGLVIKQDYKKKLSPEFLFNLSRTFKNELIRLSGKTSFNFISVGTLRKIKIPLPPLEVQKEIVEQIEVKQKAIEAAKAVIENLEKERRYFGQAIRKIEGIEVVKLSDVCEINRKAAEPTKLFGKDVFAYIDISSVENGTGNLNYENMISPSKSPSRARRIIQNGDVLLSTVRPNLKAFACLENLPSKSLASTGFAVLTAKENVLAKYVFHLLFADDLQNQMAGRMGKGSYPSINQDDVEQLVIPLPSLEIQKKLVAEAEKEQQIINANKQLIEIYEQKISDVLREI